MKKFLFSVLIIFVSIFAYGQNYTKYVNPFVGTGGHGHTFPGATVPFGMMQLSPDTRLTGWDGCSGYHYSDDIVFGFSHTHLSGTGCTDYGDILLMPTTGDVHFENIVNNETTNAYSSHFSHENEKAKPGYYSVLLDDYDILAELTTSTRCGVHKYTFNKKEKANIILDLIHRDKTISSSLNIVDNKTISGHRVSAQWASEQYIYFAIEFSEEFSSFVVENNGVVSNNIKSFGDSIKAAFSFGKIKKGGEIYVKIGISAVSVENAMLNLKTEIPEGFPFDKIRLEADSIWNTELSKIEVETEDLELKRVFYTALYHTMIHPNIYSDVDGSYRGTDLKIHKAVGFDYYTVFSLWDTYRATHPLYTIIDEKRTNDFINTFICMYKDGGKLPVWELSANYTECMIGYHSVSVIADAFIKGINEYNAEDALEAMISSAKRDQRGLPVYREKGYIPFTKESESVSKTLEYAYDDWCIARMAELLGDKQLAYDFDQRSQAWKHVFDPQTGFMRAKSNSAWFTPFKPEEVNFNYTEANSWQYSFYVPHDIETMLKMHYGNEAFGKKLDALFTADSKTSGRHQADITGLIGQYAHGNEPSHHIAYLYNYINQNWRTQELSNQICYDLYTSQPDGLCGNEDCGQMSAWYVLSSIGLYQVCPGNPVYDITSPLFDKVTINHSKGSTIISTVDNSRDNKYIKFIEVDQGEYDRSYIAHNHLLEAEEIKIYLSDEPIANKRKAARSFVAEGDFKLRPFLAKGDSIFKDSTIVELGAFLDNDCKIFYRINAANDTNRVFIDYSEPICIKEDCKLDFFILKGSFNTGKTVFETINFKKIEDIRTLKLDSKYASQYSAGGDQALIDFQKGGDSFMTGLWQGYQGQDLIATVDLGKTTDIKSISTGFLQDTKSWIFMPREVMYYVSEDGINFELIYTYKNTYSDKKEGAIINNVNWKGESKNIRYVKVVGTSIMECPSWHLGAGGSAWLFVDEIDIE